LVRTVTRLSASRVTAASTAGFGTKAITSAADGGSPVVSAATTTASFVSCWVGSCWVGLASGAGLRRVPAGITAKASLFGSSPAASEGAWPLPGLPASFQASAAASSPSSSSSLSPCMIASAMMPEFARTCASILLAMSGLSLRNCLAFSRPCPMRTLS
jgi:hypothetical protein